MNFSYFCKVDMARKGMKEIHPLEKFRYCPVCGSDAFVVNNEKSKRCSACGFVYYFNPSAATVGVVLNERRELLVVRRAKEPARDTLDLPGGFCDCHETAEEGLQRELREETGLSVAHPRFLFSLPNIYPYSGFEVHTVDLFFLCRVRHAEGAHAMDDAASLRWVPLAEVRPEEFGLGSVRRGVERLLKMPEEMLGGAGQ